MSIAPELNELIERSASGEQARRLRIFAERFFAREPADLAGRLRPEQRFAMLVSAFEFFSRVTEPVAVRVTPDAHRPEITVVETTTRDCPFIVDSLLEYFRAIEAPVRMMLHPIFRVARSADGALVSFENATAAEHPESLVHTELENPFSPEWGARIAREVRQCLREVRRAGDDFEAMTARALEICEETGALREFVEIREYLRWLVQGGFVFLGYRRYRNAAADGSRALRPEAGSGLGILADYEGSRFAPPSPIDEFTPGELRLLFEGPPLFTGKTRIESLVHRRSPMDNVMIRRADPNGAGMTFDRFVGLYTSKAYAEEAQHIPVLRAKLRELLEAEGAVAGSHDFKEIVAAFNSLPKEELFRASVEEIRSQVRVLLELRTGSEVRLNILSDPNRGHVIVLVVMPREAFSADVRMRIQKRLAERLRGKLVYYHLALGEAYTARLHFCFVAEPPAPAILGELEREVAEIARTWKDRLRDHLTKTLGAAAGAERYARWEDALSPEYRASVSVERAARDIDAIETLIRSGGRFMVELNPGAPTDDGSSELRILALGEPPILSELMPTLQNFGIRVLTEDAHQLSPRADGRAVRAFVQAFRVRGAGAGPLETMPGAAMVAEAIARVRSGDAEDDALNALTLSAGLAWREVALVRAYLAAAFQMRLAPARPAAMRVYLQHPELARLLVDLFKARLDPSEAQAAERAATLKALYLDRLGAVDNIADDRFARSVLSMVEATTRTNYFLPAPKPHPYIALKFESARILGLPDVAPLYEIHVNSPRMEGCHLRAGKVARGGIRFSDRPDDYRTEILGLMKTQTVKNAVIVPTGAKGGFIVKPHADPLEPVEAYKTLIAAMLDLTDNVIDQATVHPAGVKVLDDDGAYLVVAADKGTASYSDIANAIAIERGFWLKDAFASGGEHGYDHKRMGITARGAWESAKRHLREMGRDPMRGQPITLVGIGDMSGDVFGNGLLYSNNLKLIAAFDHRHIFLDPDPDPKKSFEERKRLYAMERSSWADYNPAVLSPGGGVFKRGEKRIAVSAEVRKALGCEAEALDGESLIRAILRAPVDMIYNGGIGTYVRASTETDADVGDHANDSCRVAASELRAKIVVEGGNLGFTQKARIEYALAGGRINTDAIDNSAGVDTSDHEVNLKILLEPAVRRGALDFAERNRILAQCQDEVAESVLRDNRDQALLLSLEQKRSRVQIGSFRDHVQAIEERGLLRRHEEALPTREALRERRTRYAGLTRPELSVITAYTKIDLVLRLEQSRFVEEPYLVERFLRPYFPPSIAERFAEDIAHHRLRRELIATRMVNELVDRMGSVFVYETTRDHGIEADDAVRAWVIGADIVGLRERAESVFSRRMELSAEAESAVFLALERAVAEATAWVLDYCDPTRSIGEIVARFRPAFAALSREFESSLSAGERERFERAYRDSRVTVNEEELALELARLAFSRHLLQVLDVSVRDGLDVAKVQAAYFGLAREIDFATLEGALSELGAGEDKWTRRCARELFAQLEASRIALCRSVLASGRTVDEGLAALRRDHPRRLADLVHLMAELRTTPTIGLAAIHVASSAVARLAAEC